MIPTPETQGPVHPGYDRLLSALAPLLPAIVAGCLWAGAVLCADHSGDRGTNNDQTVQVIVNHSIDVSTLSQYKLRTLFGMRLPSWPNGTAVRVFVLPDDHPLHRRFAKQQLGVFPHQLRRAWNNLIYSGLGQAPTVVATEQEMRDRVSQTPGGVGYINAGAVGYADSGAVDYATTGEEHAQTRILPIQ